VALALDLEVTPAPFGPGGYAGWVVLVDPCGDERRPDDVLGLVVVPAGCRPGDAILFTRRRDAA